MSFTLAIMAYELHIKRKEVSAGSKQTQISLTEWQAAVSAIAGIRLVTAQFHNITNPKTGEIISISARDGDAEVFFSAENEWYPVFQWQKGSAAFNARLEPGDKTNPVWIAAVELATRLSAVIQGDEGEIYDLHTGEITNA